MAAQVTALKFQKRNHDRVSVYLDGRFAFGLPAIVAARLKVGQTLSAAEIAALQKEGEVEKNYERALNFLSYRPRSRAEIVTYFQRRGVSEAQIEAVIERLERAGFVDDTAFARFWVENRERFRPKGLRALRYELRRKGLADKVIEEALVGIQAEDSAYRAAGKRARQLSGKDKATFERKLVDYLARRGFDYEVARDVAARYWDELAGD